MKIYSWNVNGLRAVVNKKAFAEFISSENPDIICLQETKAKPGQATIDLPEYQEFWHSAKRPGYSGTAIFSKIPPLRVFDNFPEDFTTPNLSDSYGNTLEEGRIITAEFDHFFLVNVYTPNSKAALERLPFRHQLWDPTFKKFLQFLETKKPVIFCGDLNVAHQSIDLKNPKQNTKSAGFTAEERQAIDHLIAADFIDSFRTLHPEEIKYTWWSYLGQARKRNSGWRIDYFFLSKSLLPYLSSADIHDQIFGSDHCPVSIKLNNL